MLDRRIKYLESYKAGEDITYYFIAPADYSNDFCPDSDATEISVDFKEGHCTVNEVSVSFGAIVNGEVVEWRDIEVFLKDDLKELLELGKVHSRFE